MKHIENKVTAYLKELDDIDSTELDEYSEKHRLKTNMNIFLKRKG